MSSYHFRWVHIGAVTEASVSLITDKSQFMAGVRALALLGIALLYNLAVTFVMCRESWVKSGAAKSPDPLLKFYLNRCEMLLRQKEAGSLTEWNGTSNLWKKISFFTHPNDVAFVPIWP
jgi:hypothetical protein